MPWEFKNGDASSTNMYGLIVIKMIRTNAPRKMLAQRTKTPFMKLSIVFSVKKDVGLA